jgi:hypothetical protein
MRPHFAMIICLISSCYRFLVLQVDKLFLTAAKDGALSPHPLRSNAAEDFIRCTHDWDPSAEQYTGNIYADRFSESVGFTVTTEVLETLFRLRFLRLMEWGRNPDSGNPLRPNMCYDNMWHDRHPDNLAQGLETRGDRPPPLDDAASRALQDSDFQR